VRRQAAARSLAWVLSQSPAVVALPGARSPEAVRSAVAALEIELPAPADRARRTPSGAEVRLLMGIPGSGKSRLAAGWESCERLSRDDRGGSLAALARQLDRRLGEGADRLVLDNTYLTRASRNLVVEVSARHGAGVRCVWLDTPVAQAQTNLVLRQLGLYGRLLDPTELGRAAKTHPGLMAPTSQLRAARQLEPPDLDEGFLSRERVPFRRAPGRGVAGVFVAADATSAFPGRGPVGTPPGLRLAGQRRRCAPGCGRRQLPAPGRSADLLVPATTAGPGVGVLPRARRRPGAFAPCRDHLPAPGAGDRSRRPLHRPRMSRCGRWGCRTGRPGRSPADWLQKM
jgi:hypothetical protein